LAFFTAATSLRVPLSSNPAKIIIWFVAGSKTTDVAILAVTTEDPSSSVQLGSSGARGIRTGWSDAAACKERK
jgi:hypothetical protein